MKKFIFYWLPLILFMSLIYYLSSLPSLPPGPIGVVFIDKWEHMLEYFILSILIFRVGRKYKIKKRYLIAISFASLYGVIDEIHQYFVINRVCCGYDMLANYLGSCFVLFGKLFKYSTYSSDTSR